jgi:hypothetical protein
MNDAAQAVEIYLKAADLNNNDSLREGSFLTFPDYGQVVMTGDLHGHRRNFEKLQQYCDLGSFGARHVMLHELIHEDVTSLTDHDTSHKILLESARWKCAFPDQVHFLQANHELAQVNQHEITKNGRVVTADFAAGVFDTYGQAADSVLDAISAFIVSLPLAGRTPNRVFLSHSLPSPADLPSFDVTVLSRVLTKEDLADRGSAHSLVWGRYHTEAALTTLAELLDVDLFVCGHQPQETGYEVIHDRMVILASEHNHGVFLPLDLAKPVTLKKLVDSIRPFAGVASSTYELRPYEP